MAFQLFPPPQKRPRRDHNLNRPAKPATPEPAVELMERAKSPVDFHELVIQVNSETVSEVTVPHQAHVTEPTHSSSSIVPEAGPSRAAPPTKSLPPLPQLNTTAGGTKSPSEASARTVTRAASPAQTAWKAASEKRVHRGASPVSSEIHSLRSGSPTLVRSNSGATYRTQTSPREEPVMRSIFPRYNPDVPWSQQQYHPTQASPTHIPREKISKQPYSPEFYTPHSNLTQRSAASVYYTPDSELEHLWHAANGRQTAVAARTYSLQMHSQPQDFSGSAKLSAGTPDMAIGPSYSRPLYSLILSTCLPSAGTKQCQTSRHELLIQRHHPTDPKAPETALAQLDLTTPPPNHAEAVSENDLSHGSGTLVTTIYPKTAALLALSTAANSPHASTLAPESSAAAQLVNDVVSASTATETCSLVHLPLGPALIASCTTKTSTYELRHPYLGTFPILAQGNLRPNLSSSSQASLSTSTSVQKATPGSITITKPSAEPSQSSLSKGKATNPDEILARLDLSTRAMTLDAAALMAFGNPYLIDVVATTLLAVAVAEAKRAGERIKTEDEFTFEAPPSLTPATSGQKKSAAKAGAKQKKHNRWWGSKGKAKNADLEAGPAMKSEEVELPFVTEVILAVLGFGFKAVVFVLGLVLKIVAGAVVGVSRCVAGKR